MNKPVLLTVLAIIIVGYSFGQTQYNGIENYKRPDSVIVYNYSEGDSIYYSKDIYGYDETGNQILVALYDWDSKLNDWIGYRKFEYSYDAAGNQTL
jgi:hypothetical protein